MGRDAPPPPIERLEALVGEWTLEATFPLGGPTGPAGRVAFDWMAGGRFLVQRWEVPFPEAPDGLAVIGAHEGRSPFVQHFFDARGVARLYEMTLEGREWRLWRGAPDFTPLGFHQRFAGTFAADGASIDGRWETSPDGSRWEPDFDLRYARVG